MEKKYFIIYEREVERKPVLIGARIRWN